jgi:DNA polymerase-3 subunit delta'
LDDEALATLLAEHQPDLTSEDRAALMRIADGSIGRALRLAEEGGIALYREMIALFDRLPEVDIGALHAFADKLARANAAGSFELFGELLRWWLARLVREGINPAAVPPVVAGEDRLMRRLTDMRGLDQWVEVWDKIAHLFTRAASINLDRKQTVLSAVLSLQATARG